MSKTVLRIQGKELIELSVEQLDSMVRKFGGSSTIQSLGGEKFVVRQHLSTGEQNHLLVDKDQAILITRTGLQPEGEYRVSPLLD
jgi:hypothetical protein